MTFMASKTIKESNMGCPYCRQTHCQLSYCRKLMGGSFHETYEVTVKKVENKILH
jgi:hypothetical protein